MLNSELSCPSRQLLAAMLEHTGEVRKAADLEINDQEIIHQGMGYALIAGEAILPGYLVRVIAGPKNEDDRDAIMQGLMSEKVMADDTIGGWFVAHRQDYPAFASYVMHLECMKLSALKILTSK